jgi:endonuclease/exonuclease/phosphatase family metal-dependent hydrolase
VTEPGRPPGPADRPPSSADLRVLSWNVRRLKDDRGAVVAILRAAAADVVCLQEGPRAFSRARLRRLARAAGMRRVAGDLTSVGAAVLVTARVETADPRTVRLPRDRPLAQARGVALVTVRVPGGRPVRVGSVHLGLVESERVVHARLVLARLTAPGLPAVLAGDFNEPPGAPAWQVLSGGLTDPAPSAGPTFSVARPRRRIDAILTTPGLDTAEYGQWQADPGLLAAASDHVPVLSVIRC